MAKRVRLLIYEGPHDKMERQRKGDGVRSGNPGRDHGNGVVIQSIELSPTRITLREVWEVVKLLVGECAMTEARGVWEEVKEHGE